MDSAVPPDAASPLQELNRGCEPSVPPSSELQPETYDALAVMERALRCRRMLIEVVEERDECKRNLARGRQLYLQGRSLRKQASLVLSPSGGRSPESDSIGSTFESTAGPALHTSAPRSDVAQPRRPLGSARHSSSGKGSSGERRSPPRPTPAGRGGRTVYDRLYRLQRGVAAASTAIAAPMPDNPRAAGYARIAFGRSIPSARAHAAGVEQSGEPPRASPVGAKPATPLREDEARSTEPRPPRALPSKAYIVALNEFGNMTDSDDDRSRVSAPAAVVDLDEYTVSYSTPPRTAAEQRYATSAAGAFLCGAVLRTAPFTRGDNLEWTASVQWSGNGCW